MWGAVEEEDREEREEVVGIRLMWWPGGQMQGGRRLGGYRPLQGVGEVVEVLQQQVAAGVGVMAWRWIWWEDGQCPKEPGTEDLLTMVRACMCVGGVWVWAS
jgi:hypothetical protein